MRRNLGILVSFMLLASAVYAQQGMYSNSGGTISLGSNLVMSGAAVSSPAGTFSFTCPATALPPGTYSAEWICTGGAVTIQSTDGTTSMNGAVTSGTLIETASGGGRGVPTKYYYAFSGTFTGSLTVNGQTMAVTGIITQSAEPSTSTLGSGPMAPGSTAFNAQYEPLYVADTYNARVVRIDDFTGDNLVSVGKGGSGALEFALPWALAIDSAGKIYVTDSGNCRVTRMDDMSGTNWTTLGACGSGTLQFNNPTGIAVDSAGAIYVTDTGNNRIVRFTDMSGSQWTTLGVTGSGVNQFNAPDGIAVNSAGQIFIADANNCRLVRIDNIAGTNWTTYGTCGSGPGQFAGPGLIALDATGRIYVVDTFNNWISRIDNMSGANWATLGGFGGVVTFLNPYGVAVDPYGTIFVADSRDYRLVRSDDMSGTALATYGGGSYPVFDSPTGLVALPPPGPVAVPTYSASSLTFADTVVGTSSASQTITVGNIGSAPLEVNSIAPTGDFAQTNTCGSALVAGQSCVLTVTFKPASSGTRTGSLALNWANAAVKSIPLSGIGTLVAVSPTSLNFGNVNAGGRPASMQVTVSNPGASAAGISSIVLKGASYHLTNGCTKSLAAGASCSLKIRFTPQLAEIYNGTLTVTDASGTAQVVTITGTGVSN